MNPSSNSLIDEFRAGVTACLRSWSALRTAVQSGWGGVDSNGKAETLRHYLYEPFLIPHSQQEQQQHPITFIAFVARPTIDLIDLEDNIAIYMEEEFSIVLEDNSERQIAECIWQMYEQCCMRNDVSLVRQMVSIAENAVSQLTAFPVQIQSTECDDDDDDDDDDDMDHMIEDGPSGTTTNDTDQVPSLVPVPGTHFAARDYANQYLFGPPRGVLRSNASNATGPVRQLGEEKPMTPEPEMDEDGFVTVPVKGKKKR